MWLKLPVVLLVGLVSTVAHTVSTQAALAPEYDRARQFAAVADDADVASALAEQGLMDRIEWLEDLTYKVWAQQCFVTVTLTAVPPKGGMMGPTDYETQTGPVVCE